MITALKAYGSSMFFIKDHLGSVRAVVSETGAVQQTNDYYPFGDLFGSTGTTDSSDNRYRFTGKELGNETGLYDFSARFLQTSLGRFTTIDPLAEKCPNISPYAYCNGNPVRYIDPDGRYFDETNDKRAQRMERRLERKAEKLSAKADRKEKRHKDTGDLRERAGELRKSVQDIRDMRNDTKTEYRYKSAEEAEIYGENIDGKDVVFICFADFETKVHESRHGGQHARRELNLVKIKGYGVADEVDAYRAQYAWLGTYDYIEGILWDSSRNTITDIRTINADLVNSMTDGLESLYPPAGMSYKDWNEN